MDFLELFLLYMNKLKIKSNKLIVFIRLRLIFLIIDFK